MTPNKRQGWASAALAAMQVFTEKGEPMQHKKRTRKCAGTWAAYDGNVPDPGGTRAADAPREQVDQRFIRKLSQVGRDMGMTAVQAAQFAGGLLRQTVELGERYRSVRR